MVMYHVCIMLTFNKFKRYDVFNTELTCKVSRLYNLYAFSTIEVTSDYIRSASTLF